jgi:hypothetical protein
VAVLTLALARWLAVRWDLKATTVTDRLALAALVTLLFTIGLAPATVAHPFLDRWLDSDAPAHGLAGHRHAGPNTSDPLARVIRGLRDALLSVPAAFPLALVGVAVPGWRWACGRPRSLRGWAGPAGLAVPVAGAVVILGVGVTAVTLGGMESDPEHVPVGRRALLGRVPAQQALELGDLRLTVQNVLRAAHTHEPVTATPGSAPEPATGTHRLLVEIAVANRGARELGFARQAVRLQAPTGKAWSPLAHGFPPIVLAAHEVVHSTLGFDVPASEARLELVWAAQGREVRLPLGATRAAVPERGGR